MVDEWEATALHWTSARGREYAIEHFSISIRGARPDVELIPADPSFNSSKGDRLPLDRHFDGFCTLQRKAVGIVKSISLKIDFSRLLHMFKTHDFDDVVFRQTMVSPATSQPTTASC